MHDYMVFIIFIIQITLTPLENYLLGELSLGSIKLTLTSSFFH